MQVMDLTQNLIAELKLFGLQNALPQRLRQSQDESLGFEEFLNLILHDELQWRKNQRITRLLRSANLRLTASMEALDLSTSRGIDKTLINDLATCRFIKEATNILILGATGVGKTFFACALGNAACRNGFTTIFMRMNSLLEQLSLFRAKGSYLTLLKRLSNCELLLLDDFAIKPLTAQQFQDFYDILDERCESKSTIITSQVPAENWSEIISDPVTCEAITDRFVTRAIKIKMKGESFRKKKFCLKGGNND